MENIIENYQLIVNVLNYFKDNWWWIILSLIVGITLIVMLVKWIIAKAMILLFKLVFWVVSLPVKLVIRYPILIIVMLVIGLILLL